MSSFLESPDQRCPYPDGTDVFYWTYSNTGQPVKVESKWVPWRGRVGTITDSTPVPRSQKPAPVGERVIFILTATGELSGDYERFTTHPLAPEERQQWFSVSDPPTATA